ncbi:MAG: sialate O-acetylesterase [Planctomycetota bacterium]
MLPVSAGHKKVFLLGGQSNMDGRGATSGLPPALQGSQTDVLLYEDGSLGSLQPNGAQFGPEITFGRALADANPSDSFVLIKYAVGGTDLHGDWDPSGGLEYNAFASTVTNGLAALADAGHSYEIAGMLWTQGENDARDGEAGAYEANLANFIASIRGSYGADLPFFLSRLSSGQTDLPIDQLALVRTAQDNVAAADASAFLIDTESFSLKNDELHFDSDGQIALGEAFAEAYLNSIPEPSSLALLGIGGVFLAGRRKNQVAESIL